MCGENFDDERILRKHFRSTHPKTLPFQCSVCYAEFDTNTAESEHFSTHLDTENFECIICSLNLPTYKDLYFHYKQDHVTKQQSICNICNKIFPNESQLLKHKLNHEGGHKHKCIFCQKVFCSATSLGVHMKRHTNKKLYKCKICYRAFFDTSDLMKHMLFHATVMVNERPYKCCMCFLTYKHKNLLAAHIKNNHVGKNLIELECLVCGEKLKDNMTMASHILGHSVRISKNKMSKLEHEWMKEKGPKHFDNSNPPKKGRPRKLYINDATVSTKISQNQNSTIVPIKHNTRNRNHKINHHIEFENKGEIKYANVVTRPFNEYTSDGNLSTKHSRKQSQDKNLSQPNKRQTRQLCNDTTNVHEMNMDSKIGLRKYRTRSLDTLNRRDEMSSDLNERHCRARKLSSNIEKITIDQVKKKVRNSKMLNIKYDTRRTNLKSNHMIEESKSGLLDSNDTSNKIKGYCNLSQPEIDLKKIYQRESSSEMKMEHLFSNNIVSKQRPMTFMKITSSCNKNQNKQHENLKDESIKTKNTRKTMSEKTSSYAEFDGKKLFKENIKYPNNTESFFHNIPNIRIKEEKLDSPNYNTRIYSSSKKNKKQSLNENEAFDVGYIKCEEASGEELDEYEEPMTNISEIKKEETESFIKEKKYYEPSLELTEYSCTTCLLSFPSQSELLIHNTQHIL